MTSTHRSRPLHGQSGYALIIVLALITFTGVVIAALLSMSTTTARTVASLDRAGAERRAVDGALSAALTQLRANPPTTGTADPCAPGALPAAGTIAFDQGSTDTADDVSVDVTCSPDAALETGAVAATEGGGIVSVVGRTPYAGRVGWSTNCTPGDPGPGCLPWQSTIGVVPWIGFGSQLGTLRPTLVHSGPQPLRLTGDVQVANTAAVARNPTDAPAAVQVGGQYTQGLPGPFSAQGGGPCGVLGRTHVWGAPGARLLDADTDPTCDDAAAKLLDPSPSGVTAPFPVPQTKPAVPACPGPDTHVITFAPGTDHAAATTRLNALLDGSCRNKTFWFQPGTYAFDADDASAATGDRHLLVIDDATAKVAFGEPHGWSAPDGADPDDFPMACDPTASGASISLSGRTAIAHRQGRVSICPAFSTGPSPQPYPAVVQTSSAPPVLELDSVQSSDFTPDSHLVAPGPAPGYAMAVSKLFQCADDRTPTCFTPVQKFTTTWRSGGASPLQSLRFAMGGIESDWNSLVWTWTDPVTVNRSWRIVTFAVRLAGSSTPLCTATFPGLPNSREHPASYDLLGSASDCAGKLTNESQIDGAQIDTSVQFKFACPRVLVHLCTTYTDTVSLTNVALQANASLLGASSSASGTTGGVSDWNNGAAPGAGTGRAEINYDPSAATEPDLLCAGDPYNKCGWSMVTKPRSYRLHFGGFSEAGGVTLDPDDPVESLDVLVTWEPPFEALVPDTGTATFTLSTPTGTCSAPFNVTVNTAQDTRYDLFRTPGCKSLVPTRAALTGATIDLDVTFACTTTGSPCRTWLHPLLRRLALTATTSNYKGTPPNAVITSDAGNGASFATSGKVIVPGTDLDLRWRGQVDQTRSLIADELVVHGLGSDMTPGAQMGTVCCSASVPATRAVRLEARVDGRLRGYITALISDRNSDTGVALGPTDITGRGVEVLEWDLCVGGDCTVTPP